MPVYYGVRMRNDAKGAAALRSRIKAASAWVQVEVLHAIDAMEQTRDPSIGRMEVLDDRYETHAFRLGTNPLHLLSDFDRLARGWTVLDLSAHANLRDAACAAACEAHGLASPLRAP